jgi:hypothetical protein
MILEKTTKKCPTDDCCPIRTTSSLGHFGSIKDWDMLTKINFVKNKYLWIPENL